jgi:hypothetical protein
MVYTTEKQAKEYEAKHETSLVEALGYVGDNDVLVLYYMILDKLHEANYKNPVAFKWAELCDITGETRNNASRIKARFLNAAEMLYAMSAQFEVKKGVIRIAHIVRMIDISRGGMAIYAEEEVLPIMEKEISKTTHDPSLFQADRALKGVIPLGLYLEDQLRRQKSADTVTLSAYSAINAYLLADYLTISRNYSKRLESLETRLDHLVSINFLRAWKWRDARPTSETEEKQSMIICTFAKPHTKPQSETKPRIIKNKTSKGIK